LESNHRINTLLDLLKQEPSDIFLNYALGIEYAANPKTAKKAEDKFKYVLSLDENYLPSYYQLGKLLEAQANISDALNYFKLGLEKAKIKKDNKAINEFGEAVFMLED